jgi:hypothetical protein
MSLLTLANRVAAQAALPPFSIVKTNTTPTAVRLLAFIHEAGEEITRRAEWSKLYQERTLTSGLSSYALPVDFHRLVQGGAIILNDTAKTPVLPVKAMDVWSHIDANPSSQPYFFMSGGNVLFSPALTATASFRYISTGWINGAAGNISEFAADTDTAKFSETLLALGALVRLKRANGLRYDDLLSEFEAELEREIKADRGM